MTAFEEGRLRAVVGAIGEGLLEVGLEPGLPTDCLGRGFGGDAANTMVMAALMGADARLISRVGDDAAGRILLEFWREQGLDVSCVAVDTAAPTGLYLNERDVAGNHRFSYHRSGSAASLLGAPDVGAGAVAGLDVLHVTGVTLSISASAADAARAAVDRARAAGARVSFAVNYRAQLGPDSALMLDLARAADVVFLSVEDARSLVGAERTEDVAAALGKPAEIVMTHGAEPAVLLAADHRYEVTPPAVDVVDAAGAGDALAGAYLAARCAGVPAARALAYGVAAGTLSCTGSGCARSYPSATEVARAVRNLPDTPPGEEVVA